MTHALDDEQLEKLRAFIKGHFSVDELNSALSLTLSYSPGALAGQGDTFHDFVSSSRAGGWDELLAFCVLFRRLSEATALAKQILSAHLRAGHELLLLLLGQQFTDEAISSCYARAKTTWSDEGNPSPSGKKTRTMTAYQIMCVQQAAAPEARDVTTAPLGIFFTSLMSLPGLTPLDRSEILGKWKSVATTLGLSGDPQPEGEPFDEHYSVLIELREANGSSPESPLWNRAAWLYAHRGRKQEPLYVGNVNAQETEETIKKYVADLRDYLLAQGVPLDKTTFEFFVPRISLLRAIDQWMIPRKEGFGRILGKAHPVVVRKQDRDRESRQQLKLRWKKLQNAIALKPDLHVARKSRDDEGEATYDHLIDAEEIVCLVVDSPLDPVEGLGQCPCVLAAVDAGIPLIIGSRRDGAVPDLPSKLAEWFANPPREWPRLVQQLRKASQKTDPKHLGGHVTLLFENADYGTPEILTGSAGSGA